MAQVPQPAPEYGQKNEQYINPKGFQGNQSYPPQLIYPTPQANAQSHDSRRRRKKIIITAACVAAVLLVALIVGLAAGLTVKKHNSASSGSGHSGSGSSSDCTPPGGQLCETSGDCGDVSEFSSCLTACDGFSYCT